MSDKPTLGRIEFGPNSAEDRKIYDEIARRYFQEPARVIVTVSGGVVQTVHVPPGVIVEVRDYDLEDEDIEDADADSVGVDEYGDHYWKGVWQ